MPGPLAQRQTAPSPDPPGPMPPVFGRVDRPGAGHYAALSPPLPPKCFVQQGLLTPMSPVLRTTSIFVRRASCQGARDGWRVLQGCTQKENGTILFSVEKTAESCRVTLSVGKGVSGAYPTPARQFRSSVWRQREKRKRPGKRQSVSARLVVLLTSKNREWGPRGPSPPRTPGPASRRPSFPGRRCWRPSARGSGYRWPTSRSAPAGPYPGPAHRWRG